MWRASERWQFTFGAIATGREDIPVIPAAGAVWSPTPKIRCDLMMPRPRVSVLLADTGKFQHRLYIGGSMSGGTWAFRRASALDDRCSWYLIDFCIIKGGPFKFWNDIAKLDQTKSWIESE